MFHIVKYKGVPEIWEPKEAWQLIHLGSNYSVTGKTFSSREDAEKYLEGE